MIQASRTGKSVTLHRRGGSTKAQIKKGVHGEPYSIAGNAREEAALAYAYLPKYNVQQFGLPRIHTHECNAVLTYEGYEFSSDLLVDIYCKDRHEELYQQQLIACKECLSMGVEELLSAGDLNWADLLFQAVAGGRPLRKDGYIDIWGQVSFVIRELAKWHCEQCAIDLSEKHNYLHVHHRDGRKENNARENLVSLCIGCHSNIDDLHRSNYARGANHQCLKDFMKWREERD